VTTQEKPRAVLDTMVFLQAVGSGKGAAYAVLQRFEAGDFRLFVSRDLLDEIRDVLSRPEIRRKLSLLTDERVAALIGRLERKATLVDVVPPRIAYERDPDDEPVLNLAIEVNADYLVSRDNDLLDLMKEDYPGGEAFRVQFSGLSILDPVAFLGALSRG
jgi:uncharacterized protein